MKYSILNKFAAQSEAIVPLHYHNDPNIRKSRATKLSTITLPFTQPRDQLSEGGDGSARCSRTKQ